MSKPIDEKQPPAMFAKPMFRFKLVRPERGGSMGYLLIDVLAVLPPVKDKTSKFPFPYYVCLALGTGGQWHDIQIVDADGHIELENCYEVVS